MFDIGAFLGAYAIAAARAAGDQGRVFAFEPSPFSFTMLQRHLAMNGLGPPLVETQQTAVGAREERRELLMFNEEPYRNMLLPDATTNGGASVDVVTIDGVASKIGRPPDWIRMDVQGAEFEALAGARLVLAEGRGRLRMIAEMHPQLWPGFGVHPREATDRLAALGLRARPLEPRTASAEEDWHAILEPLG